MATKKKTYHKNDFSDEEIYEEIEDEIKKIRDSGLKYVEEAQRINDLYNDKKQQKRKRKMMEKEAANRKTNSNAVRPSHYSSEDDEEGEINEKKIVKEQTQNNELNFEGEPSISNLGDHIRPLTLTRNKIVDLLNSRRFQQLVKGCFVRYLIDANQNSNNNTYIIAQIVGIAEGNKEYVVNNVKTKVLLKLQETSETVVTLSLQLISNQHPPGGLQIGKWLQTNRNKIPKEKQLKEKLEQHTKLLVEQLSSKQIDSNIWKKAKLISTKDQLPKEDITNLIDFVSEKLHNIEIQIQEESIGRKQVKQNLQALEFQRKQIASVLQKLNQLRKKYIVPKEKSEPVKKEKKYSVSLNQEKRKDAINERVKARYIMLSSIEGCNKLRSQMIQNHAMYDIEL